MPLSFCNLKIPSAIQIEIIYHSVQFSHSVMSDSLRLHGLQHARLSCPSPIPGAYSNIELVMPSNYLILCHPLLLLLSILPSIRVFSKELVLQIRWPKFILKGAIYAHFQYF